MLLVYLAQILGDTNRYTRSRCLNATNSSSNGDKVFNLSQRNSIAEAYSNWEREVVPSQIAIWGRINTLIVSNTLIRFIPFYKIKFRNDIFDFYLIDWQRI